ncbi:MTH1187 family thiamine-binding protein [Desulforudis sp. 1088]|uniref:MTH1187 family thiamine-binding protein n=1 Tax=unclassified Candidatus Desulforudis TaxID=2635950 RepID=UPI00346A2343
MAVAEISVLPVGTPTASVSAYVADCVRVLDQSGLDYRVTPMGTVVEGPLDDILRVVRRMHEAPFAGGVQRVVTTLKIDDRRDKALTMAGKVEAIMAKLERE